MVTKPASTVQTPGTIPALKHTDRCVMCGLCLPHCPTYGVTRNEGDSPRGRIALMQALSSGRLEVDAELLQHLDGCLACRACESVCPSGVPYGELIDATRTELARRRPPSRLGRFYATLAKPFVEHRGPRRWLTRLLRLAQALRLIDVFRLTRLPRLLGLERAIAVLPRLTGPIWDHHASGGDGSRGSVALFTGCAGEMLDNETLDATRRLLTRLGWRVELPDAQTCCGALYQHNAEPERAERIARRNVAAFSDQQLQAIVYTASGCGAQLAEYDSLYPQIGGEDLARRAIEIMHFLDEHADLDALALRPLEERVALHTPCSLAYVVKGTAYPGRVLRRIPGIDLVELPDPGRCCGSAGAYMVTQPEMADRLLDIRLDQLAELRPRLLATTNVGCALHFKAGLEHRGLDIEVVHPVTLLARQLPVD
jgi:glycolate oxidase iron-sulfur subunit